jgi:anti-sigma regulatory factor (Ser/Thr protein kinase)
MAEVEVAFPAEAASIPKARDALEELAEAVDDAKLADLRLMVSELITNSVRHAGLSSADRISLRVRAEPRWIRIELQDRGRGFVRPASPTSLYQETGWGLFLVEQLSNRWGVETDPRGTTVWVEVDP